MWASSLYELCVWNVCELCEQMWASFMCEFYAWVLCESYIINFMCEFYARVLCVSSMREFNVWVLLWVLCVSSMCKFCLRVLCTSSICELYVWLMWANYVCELCERVLRVSYIRKQIGGQLRPTRQVRRNIFWGGNTGGNGSASSVCELCLRVLLADKLGANWGQPDKFAEREKFVDHGRPREHKLCVRALPASSAFSATPRT